MTQPVAKEIKKPVQTLWDASKDLYYRAAAGISVGIGLWGGHAAMHGGFQRSMVQVGGAILALWGVSKLFKAHYAAEEADCFETHQEAAKQGIEIKGDWDRAKFFMIAGSAACVLGEAALAWCFGCHQLPKPEMVFAVFGGGAMAVGGMMLSVGINALKGKEGKPQEKVAQAPTQEPPVEGPQDTAGPATLPPVPLQQPPRTSVQPAASSAGVLLLDEGRRRLPEARAQKVIQLGP